MSDKVRTSDSRNIFADFLHDNGWTGHGYTVDYYPEWLRTITFPCYEKRGGQWVMTEEARKKYPIPRRSA